MKILIPVDGSEYTKRMLSYIGAHDELLGPANEYVVLTVVPAVPARAARFLERTAIDDFYKDEGEQVLKPVKAFIDQHRWPARLLVEHGHAGDVIAAVAAAEKVDLIVMGTHGHTAVGNVVLGSVTTGVIARCKTPVLLIP